MKNIYGLIKGILLTLHTDLTSRLRNSVSKSRRRIVTLTNLHVKRTLKAVALAMSLLPATISIMAADPDASAASSASANKTESSALITLPASSQTSSAEAIPAPAVQSRGETLHEYDPTEILNMRFDARVDYQRNWQDSKNIKSNSGFEGKYIDLQFDGTIVPGLTYSWRQRLNKYTKDSQFFDATDWVYLRYQLKRWMFSAGKEVVAIGGWEYDRAPINLFGCSVFWNNIPCYDLGVSVGYDITKNDQLKFQVTQSPFYTSDNRDMYAFNLFWTGNHGFYHTLWSANMIECFDGRYINYISLGNKFDLNPVSIELDLMNRAAAHQTFFFKDCSVMAEVAYKPTESWNIFAKYTYDVNKSGTDADFVVANNTELNMVGAGMEFYPLKKKKTSLRIHANCFYSWGKNANPDNVMQNKTVLLDFGITWYMNVLKVRK